MKRSVGARRIILITLLGLLISLFVVPCSFQMAISQEQEQSDKQALKKWEQYSGMTAEEYWQGWYKFVKEKKEKRAKVNELVKKYFGGKYQSLEDLLNNGASLPQEFVEEFQSLNYQDLPDLPPENLSCPPPPVEPPEWFKKEVLSESKETSSRRVAACRADIQANMANILTGLSLYKLDNGNFPSTDEGLNALLSKPSSAVNWNGPYLGKKPIDPWGREYKYKCSGEHRTDYDLYSLGEDGQEGNADDVKNWE